MNKNTEKFVNCVLKNKNTDAYKYLKKTLMHKCKNKIDKTLYLINKKNKK